MSTGTIKKDSGFGVAQLILFISIAVLVIFVALAGTSDFV